jgi:hypothetical protein
MTIKDFTTLPGKNKSPELQILEKLKPFDGLMAAEMYVKQFRTRIREGEERVL